MRRPIRRLPDPQTPPEVPEQGPQDEGLPPTDPDDDAGGQ
jgi:hypothetical protein